jgi:aldehyde:ferredoxin oxidoreductase
VPYGYNGKILRVDLSREKAYTEEPPETIYRRYLGGGALAAYYLLRELKPGIDPLGPENKIVFAASVITGVPVPGISRLSIAAKSPLTGAWGESEAGGYFAPELKFAGFDVVIVEGQARNPLYLFVHDGEVEFRDATRLWGKVTGDVQRAIHEEIGDTLVRIVQVGPAGERMVRFAGVANDIIHYHGRTGMGAVMGSKKLKAIAVRGKGKLEFKDPQKIREIAKWFSDHWKENPDNSGLNNLGTAQYVVPNSDDGGLPTRNFREGSFEGAQKISGQEMKRTILVGNEGCFACPVRCKRVVKAREPYVTDPIYGGPEYETIAALGSCCGVDNIDAIAKAAEICNAYSLDTISTGVVIAFAMECYENGIITKDDAGGLEITFGNADAMVRLTEMIAKREGIGDMLAEGVKKAAEKLGKSANRFAMHVKGQELPLHDCRWKPGACALAYAVSPTGADHLQIEHDPAFSFEGIFLDKIKPLGIIEAVGKLSIGFDKVRLFTYLQQWWRLFNSLGICIFSSAPVRTFEVSHICQLVEAATGWNTSVWELMKVGERYTTMTRCFNLREGFTVRDDWLPERMFNPLPPKNYRLDKDEFSKAIRIYYEMMGWDSDTGIPTRTKLEELEIGWVAAELEKQGVKPK